MLVLLGVCLLVRFGPLGIIFDQNPGHFDRRYFESVVSKVRASNMKSGEQREFRMTAFPNLNSFRPVKPGEMNWGGQGAGWIWAAMDANRKLKVVIQTRDLGHFGYYGFAYSDVLLMPRGEGGDWYMLDVPGGLDEVTPDMQIDEHWWKVQCAG